MTENNAGEHVVYLVHADLVNFQSLVLPPSEYEGLPGLGGRSVADRWHPPSVIVEDVALPVPDIWHVTMLPHALAVSPPVIERLEPFLSMAGELLPLQVKAAKPIELYALNVLDPLDVKLAIDASAADEERERLLVKYESWVSPEEHADLLQAAAEGDPWPVLYPAFNEEHLPVEPTFFKINRLSGAIFLLDRTEQDDTLLRRIERFGITGLVLQQVWSSETGPEPINLFRP